MAITPTDTGVSAVSGALRVTYVFSRSLDRDLPDFNPEIFLDTSFFHTVLESLGDGVLLFGENRTLCFANTRAKT
ncbi:MAG: hypothetical protein J7642_23460 [Cyanobacteria bacterium SBC]|nr:hypothetical protein [Cyanobacteria bacterium SBC]